MLRAAWLLLVLFSGSAQAQTQRPYNFIALGYCQMNSPATATGISPTGCTTFKSYTSDTNPLSKANIAEICVSTQAIRYTSNAGETPTSTIGIPVTAGTCFQFSSMSLGNLQFIQQTSGAVVDIEFFQ